MKFPLFRRSGAQLAPEKAQDEVEKLLADGFRMLGQLFARAAELLEKQRLERNGFGDQGKFLERVDDVSGVRKSSAPAGSADTPKADKA